MKIEIDPNGIWYHGSDKQFDVLQEGSTITQWQELAEAFSHQPNTLGYDDNGEIFHNGMEHGYLYIIDEPITIDIDIYQHPRTTMDVNAEFLTKRPLKVKLIKEIEAKEDNGKKSIDEFILLRKAEEIVNKSTIHTVGDSDCTADWVMSLIDEEGYPAASMITAAKADGFKWIAFCTGVGWNKPNRAKKDPRACVYLFDKESFSGISLVGKIEVITDYDLNKQLWYDALGDFFKDPADERLCVLMFKPERYNIFIEGRTIYGTF